MTNQLAPEIELLRAAYAAFNARNIDAALALMAVDVTWPKAFKGGFVRGPEEIRAYWTEQWNEINPHVEPVAFHPEDTGQVLVDVHQVVRSLAGTVLADAHVGHRFTIKHGLIKPWKSGHFHHLTPVQGRYGSDARSRAMEEVLFTVAKLEDFVPPSTRCAPIRTLGQ